MAAEKDQHLGTEGADGKDQGIRYQLPVFVQNQNAPVDGFGGAAWWRAAATFSIIPPFV